MSLNSKSRPWLPSVLYNGISVSETARKTFLLRNEFDHVDNPIMDRGSQTLLQGNKLSGPKKGNSEPPALADGRNERSLPAWRPKGWTPDPSAQLPPLFHDVLALKVLVSQPVYCYAHDSQSEAGQAECASNLKNLFDLIKGYDAKHGHLPKAAFFPEQPLTSPDSLCALLIGFLASTGAESRGEGATEITGQKKAALFTCPTCSPDLQAFGLNYVWNQQLNGERLADIEDPANTWLLMDFVGAHDWMVNNGYCGHRRGVDILYADGTVKWSRPFSTEAWNQDAPQGWLKWALE